MTDAKDPRFPVGPFAPDASPTPDLLRQCVAEMSALPARMRAAVNGLTEAQLDTPYRDGGWTVRQLVHHVADSHMNSLIRVKLALTEENPRITPYQQGQWAELPDARLPIAVSLAMLDSVHARLDAIVAGFTADDYARTYMHPENGPTRLDNWVQLYAWHSRHHVAHVTELRKRRGW